MPLTLVTGPANSAKAAVVLDGVQAALERMPLLVAPTAPDVDRLRRELAGRGVVFGAKVVGVAGLVEEMARRAGLTGRPLGEAARTRVAAAVAAGTRLDVLAASAATPGFARAAARLFAELEVARVEPRRLAGGLSQWAGEDARRRAYGEELARLYGGYRGALERLGRRDAELHALAAFDALRLAPAAWGATPVFFYGFDDLTPLERDAVETLAARVDADVMVSLSYEPGRAAFAGRATTFAELSRFAARHVQLPPRAEHYAPASRVALHGLERGLFELEGDRGLDPGQAVALLEAGGERAELELAAAEVLALLERGVPADEIALVVRSPEEQGALVERVLGASRIPFALRRRVAFAHTAPGLGLLALLRCAVLDGSAADVVAWLRAPGVLRVPELADALERRIRRRGLATAADALATFAEGGREAPGGLDRVRAAAGRGTAALCAALSGELARMLGPAEDRAGAQAVAAGRRALDELAALAGEAPELAGGAPELAVELGRVDVRVGEEPGPGRVAVTDPLALRARRVRALVLCGLQEGAFPRRAPAPAFLGDDERRELARASGIVLPRSGEGELGAERYLFYATVSRPEERLVLAFRTADDEGSPAVPSSFLDDVRDRFAPVLWERRRRRPLGAVAWPEGAPTPRDAARAAAAAAAGRRPPVAGPLRSEPVLRVLRERPAWSPSGLETWAACPVKWFVDRFLEPDTLEPAAEPLARGSLAHDVLERTLRGLREETGSARITPGRLALARERLRGTLAEVAAEHRLSPDPTRRVTGVRRLRADLERWLESAAVDGSAYEPERFELGFGFDEEGSLPALEVQAPDGPLRLHGRIDRVDVEPGSGRAVVVDYKSGTTGVAPGERWAADRSWQAALYLRAAEVLLGVAPAGAFYQPLIGDLRRRGLIAGDADPGLRLVRGDRVEPERAAEIVDEVLALVAASAAEARAGLLEGRPDTCSPRGVCAHPALCRCVTP